MKKISKGLYLLLAVIVCLTIVQPVNAKTKYTKAEKNLAYTLAVFQDSELLNPDSFKIKKISKVKYVLNKDNFEVYAACGILDGYRTITWKVDYTASNAYGGNVRESVYVTSTWNYCSEYDIDFEDYTDKTSYAKSSKSKSFVKKIKKLTSKYYKEF